ncbi:MAG: NADH-quinone oxidoreductase subunit H [Candidatus Margulisbacteria bacterium]|jgi:formate hydrogenlyase subunit 4|nr:NADH-quinone oxidoreductase subunit H [Candidatus Margulisiibacteriota bacterium]
MQALTVILYLLLAIGLAPLLSGVIARLKNNLRLRAGQSILQPYRNLRKLLGKEEIVPENSSWLFRAAPAIVFAASLTLFLLLRTNSLLSVIFVLALGRFFLALAALDAGSAFGGIGSSREMFLASFVEPAACLVILVLYLAPGPAWSVAHILAGLALLIVVLAETARQPVDNQETHLELTMVHEAMLLDHSGPALALLLLAAQIKQLFWLVLLVSLFVPLTALLPLGAGLLAAALVIALIEVGIAKYRLFKVPDLLVFGSILALLAVAGALLGV